MMAEPKTTAEFSPYFLYHQKSVLVSGILRYAGDIKAKSLLDIGAGWPSTAVPLSKAMKYYVAVEGHAGRAEELRHVGLTVIESTFPVQIADCFDLVLSCHSIPECAIDLYPEFILAAWNLVRPGGALLIVTFKGSGDDADDLRFELTGKRPGPSAEYSLLLETFQGWGTTCVERVNSYAESSDLDDIMTFISKRVFWREDEVELHQRQLRRIVELRYRVGNRFVFPTCHLFISCRKSRETQS